MDAPELAGAGGGSGGDEGLDTGGEAHSKHMAPPKRRTRTGCLTCRERHLKCDENMPVCLNCVRSKRECKRGLKLNFLDIKVETPPVMAHGPFPSHSGISIMDESRDIASEYLNGAEQYSPRDKDVESTISSSESLSMLSPLSNIQSRNVLVPFRVRPGLCSDSLNIRLDSKAPPLSSPELATFVRVYLTCVAPGLDYMSSRRLFSKILPTIALSQPSLLYALAACGSLVYNRAFTAKLDPKTPRLFADASEQGLTRDLGDKSRDLETCILTSVILASYDTMSDNLNLERENLLRSAKLLNEFRVASPKTGGAFGLQSMVADCCFWTSTIADITQAIKYNAGLVFDPFVWGKCFGLDPIPERCVDEWWIRRILYLWTRLIYFHHNRSGDEAKDVLEWNSLMRAVEGWDQDSPVIIKPIIYSPVTDQSQQCYPEIYTCDLAGALAQVFYHTCIIYGESIRPRSQSSFYSATVLTQHVSDICGLIFCSGDMNFGMITSFAFGVIAQYIESQNLQYEIQVYLNGLESRGIKVDQVRNRVRAAWSPAST